MTENAKRIIDEEIQRYQNLHVLAIDRAYWKEAGEYEAIIKALIELNNKL